MLDPELFELFWGDRDTRTVSLAAAPLATITRGDIDGLDDIKKAFQCSHLAWKLLVGVDKAGNPRAPWPLPIPVYDVETFGLPVSDEEALEGVCNDALGSLGLTPDIDAPMNNKWFEAAKAALDEVKRQALGDAPDGKKDSLEAAWPIRDGRLSLTAQPCY
ncbi:hypothetical protein NMY22_g14285 [Coprinellus aureogranulatus]|nr:hypothetical protein NMY22_g14285 [Coprinellus aureogranulatus]